MNTAITRRVYLLLLVAATVLLVGCSDKSARVAWQKVLKGCATSDLLGKDLVYLGPTNNLGAGTLFRKMGRDGFQLSLPADAYMNGVDGLIHDDSPANCKGTAKTSIALGGKVTTDQLLSVPMELGATLSDAKTVEVSVDSYRWQSIVLVPYEDFVTKLPTDSSVRRAIIDKQDRILTRALRVSGLKAKLLFATAVEPSVKATLPSAIKDAAGNGVELKATWKDDRTLELAAVEDAFIAGEFRYYKEGGLAAAGESFIADPNVERAQVVREPVND